MALYEVAGLPGRIELPVPLTLDIIPRTQTNQRPGIARQTPGYWVQHETANPAPGADARMHARWLHNGAGGAQLSFHFAVDDKSIYQMVPLNEVTWQAADGAGPGNMSGVSCELCVHAGIDHARARANAEALAGEVMRALGMPGDRLRQHNAFSGKDCPALMRSQGYWPTFAANVARRANAGPSGPSYAAPIPPPPIDGRDHVVNGSTFWAVDRLVSARSTAPRLRFADAGAPAVAAPLAPGEQARVVFAVRGGAWGGSTWWYVLANGARVPQAACRPRVTVE